MGYSGSNGSSARMLAALIQYGLLEDVGQGKVKVTEMTKALIHPKDGPERFALLNQAIQRPKMFSFFLNKHDLEQMPSDDTLKTELIRELHFTTEAAADFLKSFKQSIAYVRSAQTVSNVTNGFDTITDVADDQPQEAREDKKQWVQEAQAVHGDQWIDGPLSNRTRVELSIWGPIGVAEVKRLKRWLDNIVKPWADFHVLEDQEWEEFAEEAKA